MAAPQKKVSWDLSTVAGQERAMAAPTRSWDAEQLVQVSTRSRNRGQVRHTQQGCSEEVGLRASQKAKPASRSQGQEGKPGRVVAAV